MEPLQPEESDSYLEHTRSAANTDLSCNNGKRLLIAGCRTQNNSYYKGHLMILWQQPKIWADAEPTPKKTPLEFKLGAQSV